MESNLQITDQGSVTTLGQLRLADVRGRVLLCTFGKENFVVEMQERLVPMVVVPYTLSLASPDNFVYHVEDVHIDLPSSIRSATRRTFGNCDSMALGVSRLEWWAWDILLDTSILSLLRTHTSCALTCLDQLFGDLVKLQWNGKSFNMDRGLA
jgi:hypothetical protein